MNTRRKRLESWDRYLILAICIVLAASAIVYNIADIQIVNGRKFREESVYRFSAEGVIYPKRGDILDRNGVPIAGSRMGYCAQYVDVKIPDNEKNSVLLSLVKVLEMDNKTFKSRLTNYIDINPIRYKIDNIEPFIKSIVRSEADTKFIITADQTFQYMREKTFQIDPSYTVEEAWNIMLLRYEILVSRPQINNPLILAEDISVETMSELEERSSELRGVTTYIKP